MNRNFFKLIAGLLVLVGIGSVAISPVLARDPAPEVPITGCTPTNPSMPGAVPNDCTRPVNYFTEVFNPAILSQDVNLQSTVYEILLSLLSSMHKINFQCDDECQTAIQNPTLNQTDGKPLANGPTGFIPELASATVGFLSTPPVSGKEYLASVGRKLNIVSPVYAQGFGYEGLRPGLPVWTAFRNIAYLLATIGFVVLSFMIMLRLKISAQTVIGAQQALTKLIVVFLAVTFSYAIAGFVVDLIFVFSFVIITLFSGTGLVGTSPTQIQGELFQGNILHQLGPMVTLSVQAGETLNTIVQGLLTRALVGGAGDAIGNFLGPAFGVVGALIIGIAIVYAMLRLLFMLLMTYLEILVLTILGPIMILPDILPGGGAFMSWLKRLFANAMVWPTVTFMLLLGRAIVGIPVGSTTSTGSTFVGGLQLPFLGLPAEALQPFLGVGAILMTYQAAKMVKDALKVSAFQYSTAIGAALAFGYAKSPAPALMGAMQNPMQAASGIYGAAARVPFVGGHFQTQIKGAQAQQAAWEKAKVDALINNQAMPAHLKQPGIGTNIRAGAGKK